MYEPGFIFYRCRAIIKIMNISVSIEDYKKKKDFLVCVDSDGCAMDTMNVKHFKCFGPELVKEWELDDYRKEVLDKWNEVNLFSLTRGINRYKALATVLSYIDSKIRKIEGLDEFVAWTENAEALSNSVLEKAVLDAAQGKMNDFCLKKALAWSKKVNSQIASLDESELLPFEGVRDSLKQIHKTCDVAGVSSANRSAVKEEWTRTGIAEHVDILLCQEDGPKDACIAALLKKGYEAGNVLMIGDAPGDVKAAEQNGVHCYPILVKKEKESWLNAAAAVDRLLKHSYEPHEKEMLAAFWKNLGAGV